VVGIQAVAILSNGSMSRLVVFQSPALIAAAPDPDSATWWPMRAAMGDGPILAVLLTAALALLVLTMKIAAGAFARNAMLVANLPQRQATLINGSARFRARTQAATLRHKEWTLLRRDPWLLSQSLMQVLYLLPPALMLWHIYGSDGSKVVTLVPILVMAAGQLAGGLAWLAISGEDAPDLVASAPVTPRAILRAKIEAVLLAVALPLAPLVLGIACLSLFVAAMTIVGAAVAAGAASLVQLIFKTQGKRSNFRRRQTASRIATFAEAFVSIAIAAGAGLAAAGLWLAVVPITAAAGILMAARAITRPGVEEAKR
jgi:ABC-2 type transport system permease protein